MRCAERRKVASRARGLPAVARGRGTAVPGRTRGGFTLVEVMLVVVIGLILAVSSLPAFLRAYQGAQIRTAVRQTILATKFARNTAIMRQQQIAMIVDRAQNQVQLISLGTARGIADRDMFLESRTATAGLVEEDKPAGTGEEGAEPAAPLPTIAVELTRTLPRDVAIRAFRSSAEESRIQDVHWVSFQPNGMNDGFELELEDTRGHVAIIKVDAITGKSKVEFE